MYKHPNHSDDQDSSILSMKYYHVTIPRMLVNTSILDCLVALAKGYLEDVIEHEDFLGQQCLYCTLNTAEQDRHTDDHDDACPVTLARHALDTLGIPMRRWKVTFAVTFAQNTDSTESRIRAMTIEMMHVFTPKSDAVASEQMKAFGASGEVLSTIDPQTVSAKCIKVFH